MESDYKERRKESVWYITELEYEKPQMGHGKYEK